MFSATLFSQLFNAVVFDDLAGDVIYSPPCELEMEDVNANTGTLDLADAFIQTDSLFFRSRSYFS